MSDLRVSNDDRPDQIIDKVNTLLQKHGLWFEDVPGGRYSYLYKLKETESTTPPLDDVIIGNR